MIRAAQVGAAGLAARCQQAGKESEAAAHLLLELQWPWPDPDLTQLRMCHVRHVLVAG